MDLDSKLAPLQNLARLRLRAPKKLDDQAIEAGLSEYFSEWWARLPEKRRIGEFLTLVVSTVEVFSHDPVNLLLRFGIVIFPDLLCLDVSSLAHTCGVCLRNLILMLQRANYLFMDKIPEYCINSLVELGFVDRDSFQLFIVPDSDPFVTFLRTSRTIVQPLPIEIVDVMMFARSELAEAFRAGVREYAEGAQRRHNDAQNE